MGRPARAVRGVTAGVVVSCLLAGCSVFGYQDDLSRSLTTWQQLEAENNGYYRYETSFASWAGFGDKTTLTVQDKKVIARAYEAYTQGGNTGETTVTASWLEEGADIGSHDAGADSVTVDALYATCRNDVLSQSTLANTIYLEFRDDGILRSCEYVPKDCADDCSSGVNISGLEFLAKNE